MIITHNIQKNTYNNYANKNTKLGRDVKNEKIFKIKRGIYETNPNVSLHYLSSILYGPSYISFDYALAYYGLIPERVYTVTCATLNKKKKKTISTQFGTITYRDVPTSVYPFEVKLIEENGYVFHIATKEKALCDKLYTLPPVKNINEMKMLLFSDLRIDEDELEMLDLKVISKLSILYHSTNVTMLFKLLWRCNNE